MCQQDGRDHVGRGVVVVGVRGWLGTGLEASEDDVSRALKAHVVYRTLWVEECWKSQGIVPIRKVILPSAIHHVREA